MNSQPLSNLVMLTGRAMLATIFIVAGISKIGAYAGTQAYMESVGLPGMLLPQFGTIITHSVPAMFTSFSSLTGSCSRGGRLPRCTARRGATTPTYR